MKQKYMNAKYFFLLILFGAGFLSCSELLDVEPDDALIPQNYYRTVNDANNAVLGVYGQLFELADRYIILNELRGDLLDVTENADADLVDISTHDVKDNNRYADPALFYKIINNCNDVLANLQTMYDSLLIKKEEYEERYSDIMAIRCWLYLQLGIHYGTVPYITKPFARIDDLKPLTSFPFYTIDVLIDTLVATMKKLPTLNSYITFPPVNLNGNNMASGSWFDKKFFMAELYMWDEQYYEAAKIYRTLMEPSPAGFDVYNWHRMVSLGTYGAGTTYNTVLTAATNTNAFRSENVWVLFFDPRYKQYNTFVDLFAINGGNYLLKPSAVSIDYWRLFPSGPEQDPRGLGLSWTNVNGKPMVNKSIIEYKQGSDQKPGRWWIYRQGSIHLHYSECINRLNHHYLAWVLVNNGMPNYNTNIGFYRDSAYRRTLEPFPYDLSGLQTNETQTRDGYATTAGNFLRNAGVRGRAGMPTIPIPDSINGVPVDTMLFVENMIIDEAARELGYEGHRWPDLLRVALRRGNNDPTYLADKIYEKFARKNDPMANTIKTKLTDSKNWYLPLPK